MFKKLSLFSIFIATSIFLSGCLPDVNFDQEIELASEITQSYVIYYPSFYTAYDNPQQEISFRGRDSLTDTISNIGVRKLAVPPITENASEELCTSIFEESYAKLENAELVDTSFRIENTKSYCYSEALIEERVTLLNAIGWNTQRQETYEVSTSFSVFTEEEEASKLKEAIEKFEIT